MQEDDWKQKLTSEQYKVLREKGTEAPFSGKYLDHSDEGVYKCIACGNELFSSDTKYESKTPGLIGWPSFGEAIKDNSVRFQEDDSMGMHRTEVACAKCGGHLGHLFDDDLSPNGKHYCINSVCLGFESTKDSDKKA